MISLNRLLLIITRCEVAGKREPLREFIKKREDHVTWGVLSSEEEISVKLAKAVMALTTERESHLVAPTYDSRVLACLKRYQHLEECHMDEDSPTNEYIEVSKLIKQMENHV